MQKKKSNFQCKLKKNKIIITMNKRTRFEIKYRMKKRNIEA